MAWILSQDKKVLVDANAVVVGNLSLNQKGFSLLGCVRTEEDYIVGVFETEERAIQELRCITTWIGLAGITMDPAPYEVGEDREINLESEVTIDGEPGPF